MTTSPLFKRVPVEPTPEMLGAAFQKANEQLLNGEGNEHCKTDEERSAHAIRPIYRAMLAAAPEPPAEDGWQPIETWAPKDAEPFYPYRKALVVNNGDAMEADWKPGENPPSTGEWWPANLDSEYGEQIFPTHWQPLPAPPALSNKG